MRHFYKCYKKIYWHCFLRNPRENAIFQLDRLRNLYNLKGKENVGCLDAIYLFKATNIILVQCINIMM